MTDEPSRPHSPGVAEVVRQTIRTLPRDARRGLALVIVGWVVVILLHVWDSQDRPGPRAIAEVTSVLLGTAGLLLLGLIEILRRAQESAPPPTSLLFRGHEAVLVPESAALRRILLALPTLAVLASASLAAAVAILVVRVFLGTSPAILAIAAVYLAGLAAAVRVAGQSAERLFAFGQRESARVAHAEAQASEARLAALQAQMQPHFLFNALNTVASLIRTRPRAAETTVENLAAVLRTTLQRSQHTIGSVRDEVEFVRAYLAIERERFGERLSVTWAVDPSTLDARLPALTIQPLVENALKHGIGHRREGGSIEISAARDDSRLRIAVADNGDGLPATAQDGTGLGNLRDRLAVLYGPAATLSIDSGPDGTRARLDLPFTSEDVRHARADR